MNWFSRETLAIVASIVVSILVFVFPQYRDSITEFLEALVKFLLVVLFPEAVVRAVKMHEDAKIQMAQIARLGPNISGKFTSSGDEKDDQSTAYSVDSSMG